MKLDDDGTILTGLFKYKSGITFTKNDLLIIITGTNFRLVKVTKDFLATGELSKDQVNYGYYDEITSSADNLTTTPKLIRSVDLISYINGLAKLHKAGYILNTAQSSARTLMIPGLYKISENLSDLPPDYIPSDVATLRVSEYSETVIIQEIVDVIQNKYFVRSFEIENAIFVSMIKDWVNLNQSDNFNVIDEAERLINECVIYSTELNRLINIVSNTYKYDVAIPNTDYSVSTFGDGTSDLNLITPGDYRVMLVVGDYKLSLSINTLDPINTKYSKIVNCYCNVNSGSSFSVKFPNRINISAILKLR